MEQLSFSAALIALKQGKRLTRIGWREGLWIKLITASSYSVDPSATEYQGDVFRDFIGLKAADGSFGTCGIHDRDVLAEDWIIIE